MATRYGVALAALALPPSTSAAQLPGDSIASLAIVGVTVLPMNAPGARPGMTVLIERGVITRVGPRAEVRVPPSARIVDGAGRYLLPGFADMHAHVWPPPDLDLLLANGVTLVREMFGYGVHLTLRQALREGRRAGPRLIVASPIFEGTPPPEHDEVIVTRDRIIVDDSAAAAAAVVTQVWIRDTATGQGYATEAVRANVASHRVARGAGFALEAVVSDGRIDPDGERSDTHVYILSSDAA